MLSLTPTPEVVGFRSLSVKTKHGFKKVVTGSVSRNELGWRDESIEIRRIPTLLGACFQFGAWFFHTS